MTPVELIRNKQKNRQLLALALPMILSNITVPLLGLVDTAVVGAAVYSAVLYPP